MQLFVLAAVFFIYPVFGVQQTPRHYQSYGGVPPTSPRTVWGPVLHHVPMGIHAENGFPPAVPRKPQAQQTYRNLPRGPPWPQITNNHLHHMEAKFPKQQMTHNVHAPVIYQMNLPRYRDPQHSQLFHSGPPTLQAFSSSARPPRWQPPHRIPSVPVMFPQNTPMIQYPPRPFHVPPNRQLMPNVPVYVMGPPRYQMPWHPRVPTLVPRHPLMPSWHQPRPSLPTAVHYPTRNPPLPQIHSVIPHPNNIHISKPAMHSNHLPTDSTPISPEAAPPRGQNYYFYNKPVRDPTPISDVANESRFRSYSSSMRRPLNTVKVPVRTPQSNLYESANFVVNSKLNAMKNEDDESPREDPLTDPSNKDYHLEQQRNRTMRRSQRVLLQKRTSHIIPVQDCEGRMSCRSVYHCAILDGQPTHIACGSSSNLYCCEMPMSSEVVYNSSARVISDPECGWNRESTRRIVGGDDADFAEYPWQAFIRIGKYRCGGALISRQHVVTAAHCINRKQKEMIEVFLGELDLESTFEELPHEYRRVKRIERHPDYRDLTIDSYDVAVLLLDRPVQYREHILPICLPEPNEDFTGARATVSGWGRLYPDSEVKASHLQAVQVPVIDNMLCRRWLRRRNKYAGIFSDHMCAGYEIGGKDSCLGDSGGPLVYKKNDRWYLIGLVSAGYSCSKPMQPGIYHRVSITSQWISAYVFGSKTLVQKNETEM